MERIDLSKRIIPTKLKNTDEYQKIGNWKYNTKDYIYIESKKEKENDIKRNIQASDYAQMNNAYLVLDYKDSIKKRLTLTWLRTAFTSNRVYVYSSNKDTIFSNNVGIRKNAICPALHYSISPQNSKNLKFFNKKQNLNDVKQQYDIRVVKDKTIYHTIRLGEYPRKKVNEELSAKLEELYNNGKIKNELTCTGRWYTCNGIKKDNENYAGKHNPEFEYKGKRYVRVVSYPNDEIDFYTDGTMSDNSGTIRWTNVEPISFVIKNWKDMPKNINPEGNGKAKYFELESEEAIISNIPFYPDKYHFNCSMWQNSTVRGFLNGIDVTFIKKNGNKEFGAYMGGNFAQECNFLNEAFNLARQPMVEYTIPDSEVEIADDAFNGCVSLKKINIHSRIKSFGKNAFDGLNLKYSYKINDNLILSQELPDKKSNYSELINIEIMKKVLIGFDYNILLQNDKIYNIVKIAKFLNKTNFSIPFIYAMELIGNNKVDEFIHDTDFRFFKNENPDIINMISNFSETEQLNFFKFVTCLGCFSKEKILDNKLNETEVTYAQKASSLMATILKAGNMKLR